MPTTTDSVVEKTIHLLRAGIADGRFSPGQRLVVADLTRAFGVSAGPVREAIRRLTGEGLIEIQPHRGALVRAYSARDVMDTYTVRTEIESLAARLAARNIGHGNNRERLEALLEEASEAVEQGGVAYIKHNHAFHRLIYELADNAVLAETAERLTVPLYRMRYHNLIQRGHAQISSAEHDAIAQAILAGDEERAGAAMAKHVQGSAKAIINALPAL